MSHDKFVKSASKVIAQMHLEKLMQIYKVTAHVVPRTMYARSMNYKEHLLRNDFATSIVPHWKAPSMSKKLKRR